MVTVGARTVLALIGLAAALLSGCTTAIAGVPSAGGDVQRTTESPEPEQSEDEPTEEPQPTAETPEDVACNFAAQAVPGTILLVDLAIFEETSGLFPVPTDTRESIATVIDAFFLDTDPMLEALPPGAVREAFIVVRTESAALRDVMRAPPTGPLLDTAGDALTAASDSLATACQTR